VFAFTDTRAGGVSVEVAFTDRHGGVSGGPYASLDLGGSGSPEELRRNLGRLAESFTGDAGTPLALMRQVHGADVAVIDTGSDEPPTADALVTQLPGVALTVRAADCVPLLLADPARGIVAAAHAGRPGLVAGIVPNAVAAMRELGAADITAWLGPHVCGSCYEVPEQMRADVAAVVPEAFAETSWGTPSVDIGAGVTAQLRAERVEVVDASRCTFEDDDLYSYRRQGKESGRLAGLVWVRP
jgi:polyphenol oxidase